MVMFSIRTGTRERAGWHRRSHVESGTENWCCAKPRVFGNEFLVVLSLSSDSCSKAVGINTLLNHFISKGLNCKSKRAANVAKKPVSLCARAQETQSFVPFLRQSQPSESQGISKTKACHQSP